MWKVSFKGEFIFCHDKKYKLNNLQLVKGNVLICQIHFSPYHVMVGVQSFMLIL